jgi:hypothetical protein
LLALAASVFCLVGPLYRVEPAGRSAALIQVNGPQVVVPLTLPVAIASLPLVFGRRAVRIAAAVLLGSFAVIGGFTIGMFYLPAALAMGVAACLKGKRS